jgi:hypothetical protein
MTMHKMLPLIALATVMTATAATAATTQYSGDITSGAQYDTYTLQLAQGDVVTANAVCDTPDTLDTILSVFFPGNDPSNISNADIFNDDGGDKICGGFRASRVQFIAPASGTYTFRVDGFGSATGPYTLTIVVNAVGAPALDRIGVLLALLALAGVALLRFRQRA